MINHNTLPQRDYKKVTINDKMMGGKKKKKMSLLLGLAKPLGSRKANSHL